MSHFLFKHRNYKRLSFQFARLFVLGTFFSFFLFDKILVFMIEKNLNLRRNGYERSIYEKLPFPLTHKYYIFHVLNKDEVQNGGKPHFKEVGPFAFDEYIWKENITDNDADDTMEFSIWKRYVFRPDLSNGLTGDEIVTILHPVLNSIGLAVHFEFRQFMHVAVGAIKELFHEPKDVFWTGKVIDLLFNGIEIDCNSTEPLAKVTCNQIRRAKNPTIQPMENKRLKFSLLGGFNWTSSGRWKVLRGLRNVHHAGNAIEVDGETELKVWDGEKCNQIVGTDGLLFSPLRRKNEPITFFIKQLCSPMILNYKRMGSYRGVGLHVFTKEFEDFAANNLSCFCRQPTQCPIKGTMDMLPCMKVPITISLPHFLHADPRLLDNVASGLCPIEYKHEFFLAVQMASGIPLNGAGRIQINFEVEPVKEIEVMSKLPKMIFPWIWFEITVNLPDYLVNLLKYLLSFGITLNTIVKLLSMTYWLFGTVICSTIYILERFTNISIVEEEKTFTKSPNSIAKVVPITTVSESTQIDDGIEVISFEKDANKNGNGTNGVTKASAELLLSEVVTEATKAANRSQLQKDFEH